MYYELALISVVVAGGYWGWFFLAKRPHGTVTFGLMQLGAALLAAIGLYALHGDGERWMGAAGAIGVGAGACLLVIGPLVRGLARRAAASERLGLAGRLLDVAEVLAPGSGVGEEKALLAAMRDIRDGNIEHTVEQLTLAKERASAEVRLAIDERIAMLYLAAYRWKDAIGHAEANLLGPEGLPVPLRAPTAPGAPAGEAAPNLRRALGIAPPVWVELLGAYGRTGDLARAAQMLARLEDVCADREDAAVWIHRARLMFLALAGRPEAVAALTDRRRARHMSAAARTYWMGVALEHKGDRAGASAAYARARERSRGRPRDLIDQALARLAAADGVPAPLSDEVSAVVARVEAAPLPAEVRVARPVRPWATWLLTLAVLGVAAVLTLTLGPTSDVGVLMRGGALVRGLVDGGEWWRVFSCVLVHVGGLHLLVNAIGMWFVGRIAEELFGTTRTLALFGVAGFAGAWASYLASPAGISAGASGALFGLLGAVFVELTLHRARYRAAWKRGMWGGLVVVILGQLGYGFLYAAIDQWAHAAGLLAGVLLGAVLSPHARWARLGRAAGRGLAAVSLGFLVWGGIRVAQTSIDDSLTRLPRIRHNVAGARISAPASWHNNRVELIEPDGLMIITAHRVARTDHAAQMATWVGEEAPALALQHGFEKVALAPRTLVRLPPPWEGVELVGSFTDPVGAQQQYRLIVCGRAFGGIMLQLMIATPATVAEAAPGYLRRLVASVTPL